MEKPRLYLDNEGRLNDRYAFISYSHKDNDVVYKVLNELSASGINFWYDDGLNVGDFWNERVEKILNNPDCVGAFVFLSENSIISDPVNKEVGIMLGLKESRDFRIAPVVVGDFATADDLIYDVCSKSREFSKKTRSKEFYINDIAIDDISCNAEDCVAQIKEVAALMDITEKHSVITNATNIDKLPHVKEDRQKFYKIGHYPQQSESRTERIAWEIISNDSGIFTMLSQRCLDFVALENINSTLGAIQNSIHEYKEAILSVCLPDEKFLQENSDKISDALPTEYADCHRTQLLKAYWIVSDNEKGFSLYNSLNAKIKENINYENITAGIRPIIKIDSKKIKSEVN